MALAALPKSLLGPHDTIGSTLLHCESGPTHNIRHFQSMGPLENSGCFYMFLIGGPTWAFLISSIKLHYGFSRLLQQCMRHWLLKCANCFLVMSVNAVRNACSNLFHNLSLVRAMGLTVAVTLRIKSVSCSFTQSFMLGPLMKCRTVTTCLKGFYILTCSSLIVRYKSHCCMNVSAFALFLVNVSRGVPFIYPVSGVAGAAGTAGAAAACCCGCWCSDCQCAIAIGTSG